MLQTFQRFRHSIVVLRTHFLLHRRV